MKIRLRGPLSKPVAAEGCLDPDALKYAGEQTNKQLIQSLKNALADADASLTKKFHNNEDVNQLVKARAWVVDQLIIHAWTRLIPAEEDISLVAVGGFGRTWVTVCGLLKPAFRKQKRISLPPPA